MVPAHAQRMSSLLAAEREFVFCRVIRRGRTGYEGPRTSRIARVHARLRCTQRAGEMVRLADIVGRGAGSSALGTSRPCS